MAEVDFINNPKNRIAAAIRTEKDFSKALRSEVDVIFLLHSNIMTVNQCVKEIHGAGKKAFVHGLCRCSDLHDIFPGIYHRRKVAGISGDVWCGHVRSFLCAYQRQGRRDLQCNRDNGHHFNHGRCVLYYYQHSHGVWTPWVQSVH